MVPLPLNRLLDIDGCWLKGDFFWQPEVFWTRDIWERSGAAVAKDLYYSMDYDLWVRLAKHRTLRYHPRVWAQFRMHAASKTMQDDMLAWPEMLRVHQREGGKRFSLIYLKYVLRRLLRPIIALRHRWRLRG